MTEGPGCCRNVRKGEISSVLFLSRTFKRSVGVARALGRIQEPHLTGADWNHVSVLRRRERAIPVRVVSAVRVAGVAEIDDNVSCLRCRSR